MSCMYAGVGWVGVGVNGYCFWCVGGEVRGKEHMVKPDVIINMFLRKKVRSSPPPPSFNLSRARVTHMLWVAGGGCLLYRWGGGQTSKLLPR